MRSSTKQDELLDWAFFEEYILVPAFDVLAVKIGFSGVKRLSILLFILIEAV